MNHISEDYLVCLGILQEGEPRDERISMISSVTGRRVTAKTVSNAQYWVDNLVSPVRFTDALSYLASAAPKLDGLKAITDYIEIGPHGALQRPLKETLTQVTGSKAFRSTSILSKNLCPLETMLEVVGQLFAHGHPVSVSIVNQLAPASHETSSFLVDTPEYPFDHSKLYWNESKISRDWRFRSWALRSVLGAPAADWNPLEPRWRKILSVEEVPWVADHIIVDTIFFPATGMLAMAVKAVKQTAGAHNDILGYYIKEAVFTKPIVVREELSTEVITHLRLLQDTYEKKTSRFEVRLFAYTQDQWGECFKAVIHIDYRESSLEVDGGHEAHLASETLLRDFEHAKMVSTRHFDEDELYKWLRQQGLRYGKLFALAKDIYWDGGGHSVARVDVPQVPEMLEGVIHPAVLDACCHISTRGWSQLQEVQTFSSSTMKPTGTGIECSITVLTSDGSPLYHVERFEMLPITGGDSSVDDKRLLVYGIDWRPHLPLMSPDQLRRYCDSDIFPGDEGNIVQGWIKLERILNLLLQHSLDQLPGAKLSTAPPHMKQFVFWLERHLQPLRETSKNDVAQRDISEELERLQENTVSWTLFIEVAQNIGRLVNGEIDSQELLDSRTLLQNGHSWDRKISSFLRLAAHETPNQRILHVGWAVCGIAGSVLSALQEIEQDTGGIAFSEFVFMDARPSVINQCKEDFANVEDRITFSAAQDIPTLDIEPGAYNMIIVDNTLSASTSLGSTLKTLRNGLKPGGHLIIHDLVEPNHLATILSIGVLAGGWSSRERPFDEFPKMPEEALDTTLREYGFSGNDVVFRDFGDDATHHASVIISTLVDIPTVTATSTRALVVVGDDHERRGDAVSSLSDCFLSTSGYQPKVFSISQLPDAHVSSDDVVIWLVDLDKPFLAELSNSSLELVKGWIKQSKNMLWVTLTDKTKDPDSVLYPHSGLKDGFLRSIRLESNDKRIISLSLESEVRDAVSCAKATFALFESAFRTSLPSREVEYIIRDGPTLTGRLVVDNEMDTCRNAVLTPQAKLEPWGSGPPLKLDVASRGSLDTLRFIEDLDNYQPLGPSEIEIEAKAWGVNFRDVFIALGRLEENDFGSDCAGVVTRVGFQCDDIRPGDRVYMCASGCMKAFPRANQFSIVQIPHSMSFEEACGVLGPSTTAWYSLVEVGRLQKGEKVLIHAASGATGQLAIQVAKIIGAEIFATVGFNHKKQLLRDTYDIPDDHIFFSRNTSFAKGIMRQTKGAGVDVVLNSLVGEGLRASWDCIAPYGRFVEIGKADIQANSALPMGCFAKNVSFSAVDLRHIMLSRPAVARDLALKVMQLALEGSIQSPKPLHLYDVCALEDAFRYFQSGKNTGRTVIKIDGGINVEGAKYIIVASRSGIASDAAAKLVDELTQEGATIATPQCDMASEDSVSKMLERYSKILPTIRGCINAAMALNDSTFDKMSHAQWEDTIRSKALTSWNLSKLLPKNLEFLIFLSSATGVGGNVGTPNYAAGCAFQDSLAAHRVERYGDKTLSIDLGVMSNVGVVAETASLRRVFSKSHSHVQVEDEDLLALLDVCCDPAYRLSRSQVIIGVPTPAELNARGVEVIESLKQPLFGHFSQFRSASSGGWRDHMRPGDLFQRAETDEERVEVVVESLAQKVASMLSIDPGDVERSKPLHVFGVDSLVAVELRNWMKNEFAAQIPVFEITGGKTIELIGDLVCKESKIKKAA
ncbi:hypothetical protein SLS62_000597 [Diatrype stigma]|uniref:Carrier domain-containing protein n=1 Tax=Diatrype stigma TaxID=117547 RepID=A0AAN9V376_9PEZI